MRPRVMLKLAKRDAGTLFYILRLTLNEINSVGLFLESFFFCCRRSCRSAVRTNADGSRGEVGEA